MTAAQRATLEQMADYAERFARMDRGASMSSVAAFHAHRADALRAALGTCGTCAHSSAWPDGVLACNNTRGLNREEVGPGESCSGWTAKEGA